MVGLLGPVEFGPAGGVMSLVAQPQLRVLPALGDACGRSCEGLHDGEDPAEIVREL